MTKGKHADCLDCGTSGDDNPIFSKNQLNQAILNERARLYELAKRIERRDEFSGKKGGFHSMKPVEHGKYIFHAEVMYLLDNGELCVMPTDLGVEVRK